MNCQKIKKLLIPFLHSELPEKERLMVEAHLQTCPECQKEKALLEHTWSMLDDVKAPEVSSDFTASVMAKIHEQEQKRPWFGFAFSETPPAFEFWRLAPVLATVCLVVLSYVFFQDHVTKRSRIARDSSQQQDIIIQTKDDPEAFKDDGAQVVTTSAAMDVDIIRYLDVYENMEFYQDYALLDDYDVVEDLNEEVL